MKCLLVLLLLISPVLYGKQRDSMPASRTAVENKTPAAAPKLVMGSVSQWQVRAEERFPDLRSPASAFNTAFQNAYEVMQEDNPAFLVANDWPMRLAESVAQSIKAGKSTPLAAVR